MRCSAFLVNREIVMKNAMPPHTTCKQMSTRASGTVSTQCYFVLVSGVQLPGQTSTYFTYCPPYYLKCPPGAIHSYYIIDYICSQCCTLRAHSYLVTTNLYLLLPSLFPPNPLNCPPHLVTIALFFVLASLFLCVCSLILHSSILLNSHQWKLKTPISIN